MQYTALTMQIDARAGRWQEQQLNGGRMRLMERMMVRYHITHNTPTRHTARVAEQSSGAVKSEATAN